MLQIYNNIISHFKTHPQAQYSRDEIISTLEKLAYEDPKTPLDSNGIHINPEQYYCCFKGDEIKLTLKEFQLLYFLIDNRNCNLTRDRILSNVWDTDVFVLPRTIDVHITKLRSKFGKDMISTNKGMGYMWVEK